MSRSLSLLCGVAIDRLRGVAGRFACLVREEPLPQRPLVLVAGGLVAGAMSVRWLPATGVSPALPCWFVALAAMVGWRWAKGHGWPRLAATALVAAAAATGAAWSAAQFDWFSRGDLAWQLADLPRPVAIRGRVIASPRPLTNPAEMTGRDAALGSASEFLLAVTAIRDHDEWRPAAGRATVIVRGAPVSLDAGTDVRIFGRGLRPAIPLNPGEPDRAALARGDRCLSVVRVAGWECIGVLARRGPWSPTAFIERLRASGHATLAAGIAPARVPFAQALLMGGRGAIPRDLAADFVATGTVHVLSISGLHLGLLAAGLFVMLRSALVPRGWSLAVVAVVTGLYAVLVGAETPVVRALLMVWVACLAGAASRCGSTINALAVAAIVIVAWRPAEAASTGAQLSFLSTAVLVGAATLLARPPETDPIAVLVERSRSRWEKTLRGGLRAAAGAFVVGLAVSLATAPLVAARFHVVSPVGLVANVLIAPLVPVAMACGLLCLLAGAVSQTVAAVFAAGCDAALAIVEAIVAVAADLPAGHAWVAGPAWWWVCGWYALMLAAAVWGRRELIRLPATWGALAAGWCGVGLLVTAVGAASVTPPGGLRVVMTAVGHGCGILVRAPTGRSLLYDAGRLGAPSAACRSLSAVLWSERVTRIDTLVVSHADADHFNAVPDLLERFSCGELLVPKALLTNESPAVAELLAAAAARGVPVRTARSGDAFAVDPLCRVRVLHPSMADGHDGGDDNATSLVLSVESAGRRLLLTGDLDGAALESFIATAPGSCDVLLAPHHGAATSIPAGIARATEPSIVLVSGRGGRAWPVVRDAYVAASGASAAAVLKTGGEGAVAVTLTAGAVTAERFEAGRWRAIEPPGDQAAATLGRVRNQPPTINTNWLVTYAASSSRTPLVNP
jgi:competence protein ComEC